MKNYWKRLLTRVFAAIFCIIVILYTFEMMFPDRVNWETVFTLTNTLVDAWGNIILMLIVLAYLGYTRNVMMKSLAPFLNDLKSQSKDLSDAIIVSIDKINNTMKSLEDTLEASRQFVQSDQWRKELQSASDHLQKQLEELAKSAGLREDAIELKNAIVESLAKANKAMDKLAESTEDLKVYLRNNQKKIE